MPMSIGLAIVIIVLSLILSCVFVTRDAKRFALKPPTPLIDLDRMYDVIFDQLDDVAGSAITPAELSELLTAFVSALGSHSLIREDIAPDPQSPVKEELSVEDITNEICEQNQSLDVPKEVISDVVELALNYLRDIRALT
ncbi:MAG TPA: hypothetical protein PKB15_08035 [Acidimicrobiia bacterium]|nr:hypothetical protein [Acidimicrobiia bacterium]